MPDTNLQTEAGNMTLPAGVPSIDSATWVDPKETFPGGVILSAYRYCPEGYMEPNQFRKQRLPRPVVQWSLHVLRYNQVWQNADGSQSPRIYYYGGFDLERLNTRTGEIEPISLRANKEALISTAWKTVFGVIDPPEKLIGKKATFDFYPSKRMQRGNVASNILLPVVALPDDYVFTGEVEVLISRRDAVETAGTDGQSTAEAVAQTVSYDEAIERLPGVLAGQNVNNLAGLVNALPQELRSSALIDDLINGAITKRLQEEGKITVGADGAIA